MRFALIPILAIVSIVAFAKDKQLMPLQVVDTETSQREFTQFIPGTQSTSSTSCSSNASVYGTGMGSATAMGSTNCTTSTVPGQRPTTVLRSIEQVHVQAIMPDGRHLTLWCQAGFRHCSRLTPGRYRAELAGNSVFMEVYDLDGTTKHRIKYRFEGEW